MKQKKKSRKLLICIFFIMVLGIIIYNLTGKMFDNQRFRLLLSIGFTVLFSIVVIIPFLPVIIAKKVSEKNVYYEKLSKNDIINNKQIYRDILNQYTPSELLYIDNMKYDYRKTIISTLLYLKQNKYISIKDNFIIKEKEVMSGTFGKAEKIIIENIKNGKVNLDSEKLKNAVIEDSIKNGIIEANYDIKQKVVRKVVIAGILFIILLCTSFVISSFKVTEMSILFSFILGAYPIGAIIYIVNYYTENNKNPLHRTRKGEEINLKLEGLKNYIKEYSLLNTREADEIEIWEDYLIYSVMFGQNEGILNQYNQLIVNIRD